LKSILRKKTTHCQSVSNSYSNKIWTKKIHCLIPEVKTNRFKVAFKGLFTRFKNLTRLYLLIWITIIMMQPKRSLSLKAWKSAKIWRNSRKVLKRAHLQVKIWSQEYSKSRRNKEIMTQSTTRCRQRPCRSTLDLQWIWWNKDTKRIFPLTKPSTQNYNEKKPDKPHKITQTLKMTHFCSLHNGEPSFEIPQLSFYRSIGSSPTEETLIQWQRKKIFTSHQSATTRSRKNHLKAL